MRTTVLALCFLAVIGAALADAKAEKAMREFFKGLSEGQGLPVSEEFLWNANFKVQDFNITEARNLLEGLGIFNVKEPRRTIDILNKICVLFRDLWATRWKSIEKDANFSKVIVRSTVTLKDSIPLVVNLFQKKKLGSKLYLTRHAAASESWFALGRLFGNILRECIGTYTSLFLSGLSTGLDRPVEVSYLIDNDFDSKNLDMKAVIGHLLPLKRARTDKLAGLVHISFTQVYRELTKAAKENAQEVEKNENLKEIFTEILPAVFADTKNFVRIIEDEDLLANCGSVGKALPYDVETAGQRLGLVLKAVYDRIRRGVSKL
eukprot:TRINITY_DN11342_c0_g5_i1.p1 TRINITY_DN11342_c0_g5~~TRINITY_DN11342_c0_g5_i1.p1  ORF type:complete len:320 (+),score=110.14 TRINITY_DN11342_c0_g5_i1:117-1076(+)